MKEGRHKRVHTVWFQIYGIPEQAKLSYVNRNQMTSRAESTAWGGGVHRGLSYIINMVFIGVVATPMYSFHTIHLTVHIR